MTNPSGSMRVLIALGAALLAMGAFSGCSQPADNGAAASERSQSTADAASSDADRPDADPADDVSAMGSDLGALGETDAAATSRDAASAPDTDSPADAGPDEGTDDSDDDARSCLGFTSLVPDVPLSGLPREAALTCPPTGYALKVPPGQRAIVTRRGAGSGVLPEIYADCAPWCGGSSGRSTTGVYSTRYAVGLDAQTVVDNPGTRARTVMVAPHGQLDGFELDATLQALAPSTGPSAACAPASVDTLALPDAAIGGFLDEAATAPVSCALPGSVVRRYVLALDAVTTIDVSGNASAVAIRRACDASGEIVCSSGARYTYDHVPMLRRTLEPGTYDLLVAGPRGGGYVLRVRALPTPASATCASSTPLTVAPAWTRARTDEGRNAPAAACGPTAPGEHFFAVTVPPGQRVVVAAEAPTTRAATAAVRLIDGCDAASCLAPGAFDDTDWGAPYGPPPFGTGLDNRGPTARTVLVAAGSATPTRDFDLWLRYELRALPPAIATNAACAAATPLVSGTHLSGENTAMATDVSAVPGDTRWQRFTGKVLYYTASVPAGATLTLRMNHHDTRAVVMRVLDHCGGTAPLASVLSRTAGHLDSGTTTLTFTNTAPNARQVVIEAGPVSAVDDLVYDLDAAM